MEDNGVGKIIGVDPERRVEIDLARYYGRFQLVESDAPKGIDEAARLAGGKFDLVFYDGPNVHTATSSIIAAIIPHLSERAYIVIDNGFTMECIKRLLMRSRPTSGCMIADLSASS